MIEAYTETTAGKMPLEIVNVTTDDSGLTTINAKAFALEAYWVNMYVLVHNDQIIAKMKLVTICPKKDSVKVEFKTYFPIEVKG